jgi:hypothetical protein
MKILGPGETGKTGIQPKQKKEGITGGQDFGKILAEESEKIKGIKSEKVSGSTEASGPRFPSNLLLDSVESVAKGGKTGELTDQKKILALTEQVLARLDFFKAALENPKVDISKFSPLIESLKNDSKSLEKIAPLVSSNPALKSLADDTLTLAATEAAKFYRGDYG